MKLLIIVISTLLVTSAFGQNGETEGFAFGGPEFKRTHIAGKNALIVGGKGGKLITEHIAIGGGGYALVNNVENLEKAAKISSVDLAFGGVTLTYFTEPYSDFIFSSSVLLGGGGLSYTGEDDVKNEDEFFVMVPSLDVQHQTFSFLRIGLGIGYRFINGTNLTGIKDSDLSGVNLNLSFMFGNFIED